MSLNASLCRTLHEELSSFLTLIIPFGNPIVSFGTSFSVVQERVLRFPYFSPAAKESARGQPRCFEFCGFEAPSRSDARRVLRSFLVPTRFLKSFFSLRRSAPLWTQPCAKSAKTRLCEVDTFSSTFGTLVCFDKFSPSRRFAHTYEAWQAA